VRARCSPDPLLTSTARPYAQPSARPGVALLGFALAVALAHATAAAAQPAPLPAPLQQAKAPTRVLVLWAEAGPDDGGPGDSRAGDSSPGDDDTGDDDTGDDDTGDDDTGDGRARSDSSGADAAAWRTTLERVNAALRARGLAPVVGEERSGLDGPPPLDDEVPADRDQARDLLTAAKAAWRDVDLRTAELRGEAALAALWRLPRPEDHTGLVVDTLIFVASVRLALRRAEADDAQAPARRLLRLAHRLEPGRGSLHPGLHGPTVVATWSAAVADNAAARPAVVLAAPRAPGGAAVSLNVDGVPTAIEEGGVLTRSGPQLWTFRAGALSKSLVVDVPDDPAAPAVEVAPTLEAPGAARARHKDAGALRATLAALTATLAALTATPAAAPTTALAAQRAALSAHADEQARALAESLDVGALAVLGADGTASVWGQLDGSSAHWTLRARALPAPGVDLPGCVDGLLAAWQVGGGKVLANRAVGSGGQAAAGGAAGANRGEADEDANAAAWWAVGAGGAVALAVVAGVVGGVVLWAVVPQGPLPPPPPRPVVVTCCVP
jgi:hypothetical protein